MDATKQGRINKYIEDSLRASDYSDLEASVWNKIIHHKQNKKSVFTLIYNSLWLKFATIALVAFGLTFGLIFNEQKPQKIVDEQFSVVNEVKLDNEQKKAAISSTEEQVVADVFLEHNIEVNNDNLLNELENLLVDIDRELGMINPNEDLSDFEL